MKWLVGERVGQPATLSGIEAGGAEHIADRIASSDCGEMPS
jgi:hypothetical protein